MSESCTGANDVTDAHPGTVFNTYEPAFANEILFFCMHKKGMLIQYLQGNKCVEKL